MCLVHVQPVHMSWTPVQAIPFWALPLLRLPKKGERPVIDTSSAHPLFLSPGHQEAP